MSHALASLLLFATLGQDSGTDTKPKVDPQKELDTAIPAIIELLEKKEFVKLIRTYVSPGELEKIAKRMTVEALAEEFGKSKKAGELLKVLEHVRTRKPVLGEDGTTARYEFEIEGVSRDDIEFEKVEGKWYVEN